MNGKGCDIGRLYGYVVCFVAVLTLVHGSYRLVQGILNFRELQYTEAYATGPSLTSAGAYRMDLLRRLDLHAWDATALSVLPADSDFQQMFEQERLYRLALSHQTYRSHIVLSVVLVGMALLLFLAHWAWLQRRESRGSPGPHFTGS